MDSAVHILERLHWRERRAKQAHISEKEKKRIALVGSPNVGKSVLFHRLTGTYVTVSN
jgi:ferrous iron transport protein B